MDSDFTSPQWPIDHLRNKVPHAYTMAIDVDRVAQAIFSISHSGRLARLNEALTPHLSISQISSPTGLFEPDLTRPVLPPTLSTIASVESAQSGLPQASHASQQVTDSEGTASKVARLLQVTNHVSDDERPAKRKRGDVTERNSGSISEPTLGRTAKRLRGVGPATEKTTTAERDGSKEHIGTMARDNQSKRTTAARAGCDEQRNRVGEQLVEKCNTDSFAEEGSDMASNNDEDAQRSALIEKWSKRVPDLDKHSDRLITAFPAAWSTGQKLLAADEALEKTSLLDPSELLRQFAVGVEAWIGQWIDSSKRTSGASTPDHLRGNKDYQEFWVLDKNIQVYEANNVVSAALLRLAKVRIAEKYDDMKYAMRLPGVKRRHGQTAAAKAKEVIFETAYPDEKERAAAKKRFQVAQLSASVLHHLCSDHSYGVLAVIPPQLSEYRALRPNVVEFDAFRRALRLRFGTTWKGLLELCSEILVAISEGRQPRKNAMIKLKQSLPASTTSQEI